MAPNRYHVRSISLPSRSHPSTLMVEEELNKLKTLSRPSSSDSLCIGLSKLDQLYECVDYLLNLGSSQQVISQNQNEKCIAELLDGSLRILDMCGITRDILLKIKEHVQSIQSALRRRKGESSIESSICSYLSFRKKMKKDLKRLSVIVKQMENKHGRSSVSDQDFHLSAMIRVLREVNAISVFIFESLLVFLSSTGSKTNQNKWSLVSKLMRKGVISCEEKQDSLNELENVDDALSLCGGLSVEKIQIANKRLEAFETVIEDLENGLESLFRRLIKARASFLNIISQ